MGLFIGQIPNFNYFGLLLQLLSAAAITFNIIISQKKVYGLKLYVNSGDAQIFITSDTDWLKRVVGTLYDFMENAEEGSSMTIQVGGNISGNIVQGSIVRDVKNLITDHIAIQEK